MIDEHEQIGVMIIHIYFLSIQSNKRQNHKQVFIFDLFGLKNLDGTSWVYIIGEWGGVIVQRLEKLKFSFSLKLNSIYIYIYKRIAIVPQYIYIHPQHLKIIKV